MGRRTVPGRRPITYRTAESANDDFLMHQLDDHDDEDDQDRQADQDPQTGIRPGARPARGAPAPPPATASPRIDPRTPITHAIINAREKNQPAFRIAFIGRPPSRI